MRHLRGQLAQRGERAAAVGEPRRRIALEHARDVIAQPLGHALPRGVVQRRRALERRRHDRAGGRAAERRHAGDQLVEDHAEREDVDARVERLAGTLLGRHVARRARRGRHAAALEHRRPSGRQLVAADHRVARQPEVDELDAALRRQHHVLRLQIAMDHALGVELGEALGDLGRDVDDLRHRHLPAPHPLAQRAAGHVLHRDEGEAVVRPDVVHPRDPLVLHPCGDPGLAQQPRVVGRVAIRVGRVEDLERDDPVQHRVGRRVDRPHPAAAQAALDQVARRRAPRRSRRHRAARPARRRVRHGAEHGLGLEVGLAGAVARYRLGLALARAERNRIRRADVAGPGGRVRGVAVVFFRLHVRQSPALVSGSASPSATGALPRVRSSRQTPTWQECEGATAEIRAR